MLGPVPHRILQLSVVCHFVAFTFVAHAQAPCIVSAWSHFNTQKYTAAIQAADECIDEFGRASLRMQEELIKNKERVPPTGKVSDQEKRQIFSRGVLNDVATAYWIKGRSAEYLSKRGDRDATKYKEIASHAYESTCKLPYGRTWDPKGWFWSPCESARDRMPLK